MKTYNQVIKVLSDIAAAHQQVETFGEGDVWDIAENTAYPLMYVTPQPGSLNIERSETSLSLAIIFADLAKEDKSNEAEVRSDMQQIAFDVLAQLQLPDYVDLFTVNPSARLTPFSDAHPDRVTGWVLELTLRMDYLSDWCIVPSTLTPGTEVGCPTVNVYDSAALLLATVAAGGTYTVTDTTIKNSAGTTIGTGVAQGIITLADKTLTNSDASFSSPIVQGIDKVLADINVTDYLGVVTAYPAAKNITITSPARTYAYPHDHQAAISYRTGDSYWVSVNRFAAVPATGWMAQLDPSNSSALLYNNVFGNLNRFTDSSGGQTYANQYIIDHYTGLGWMRITAPNGNQAGVDWNGLIDWGVGLNRLGFSDWWVTRLCDFRSISKYSSPGNNGLQYSPFSGANSTQLPSSTTDPLLTTNALAGSSTLWYQPVNTIAKTATTGVSFFGSACRKHF